MQRQILSRYLGIFKKIYPTHPDDSWEIYERVLSDVNDTDLIAACEICLRELKYFPMPAEIRQRVTPKDTFISTAPRFEDNPPDPETKRMFQSEMDKVAEKLGLRNLAKQKSL